MVWNLIAGGRVPHPFHSFIVKWVRIHEPIPTLYSFLLDSDRTGNVTNDGANKYLYDAEGRICAVASTMVSGLTSMTCYIYDADGTRVSKGSIQNMSSCDPALNGFQTTNDYILGSSGEQVTEIGMNTTNTGSSTANAMTWQHTNVYAVGTLIATYDNDGLHFYLNDPLGTRRAQTDYAGVLEQTCSSLPYGDGRVATISVTGPNPDEGATAPSPLGTGDASTIERM